MKRTWYGGTLVALGVALMPTSAAAQVADADEWRFAATPWLWLVNMSGTVAIAGRGSASTTRRTASRRNRTTAIAEATFRRPPPSPGPGGNFPCQARMSC